MSAGHSYPDFAEAFTTCLLDRRKRRGDLTSGSRSILLLALEFAGHHQLPANAVHKWALGDDIPDAHMFAQMKGLLAAENVGTDLLEALNDAWNMQFVQRQGEPHADSAFAVFEPYPSVWEVLTRNNRLIATIEELLNVKIRLLIPGEVGARGMSRPLEELGRLLDQLEGVGQFGQPAIRRRVREIREFGAAGPKAPDFGPGSILVPTDQGFEIQQQPIPSEERSDRIQRVLYSKIIGQISDLYGFMARISNTHPALAAEFADYTAIMGVGLDTLDVASAWSVGSGLAEMVSRLSDATDTMTPALEPEPAAILASLVRNHIAFVQGFEAGRALTQRVVDYHQAALPVQQIRTNGYNVVRAMLDTAGLIGELSRHLLQALRRELENVPDSALQIVVATSETARNGVISIGRYIQSAGGIIPVGDKAKYALMALGVAHPEILEPSIALFRDHAAIIMAFAAMDPQIYLWLEWLVRFVSDDGLEEQMDEADKEP